MKKSLKFLPEFDWYFDSRQDIDPFRNQFHAVFNVWYEYKDMGIKSNRKYKVRFFQNK